MWDFLRSHAGRATLGLGLFAGLFLWPPMLSWLAATFSLAYALHHYREAFRRAEAEEAASDPVV